MQIELNDVKISVDLISDDSVESEGKALKVLEFEFQTETEIEFNLFKNLFSQNEIRVKLFDNEFKVKVNQWSYSHRDEDYSGVPFKIKVTEIDPDHKEWNTATGAAAYALQSMLRIDTLKELFLEKGLITEEEIKNKFEEVMDRDYQKRLNFFLTGDENKE